MDRRGLRAIVVLAYLVLVLIVVFGPGLAAGTPTAAGAPGSPDASMAGPTSLAAIGPTATPSVGDLQEPTADPAQTGQGPKATSKPGRTPEPTAGPTPRPPRPTAAPTDPPGPDPTQAATTPPTPKPTSNPGPCPVFPSSNVWNKDVSGLAVASNSATMIAAIGLSAYLHPDFSSTAYNGGKGYGIPINKVDLSTPTYPVSFQYASESDKGPYPIPSSPKIEGGSDRHLILWDTEGCNLYELYAASYSSGTWHAGSGAIWDLRSNALRPNGWTSADAAGLPILPGLIRYDEVAAGAIRHAIRFTAPDTCAGHIYPARHDAGSGSCSVNPPMGLRVRLKASVDISGFGGQARVILTALKKYGMILADNGSPWYITGAPDSHWNDDQLHVLQTLHGSDFEVVDTSGLRNG